MSAAQEKGMPMGERETATILAALRYWQREGLLSAGHEQEIASDGGGLKPLSAAEIDRLCEAINFGEPAAAKAPTIAIALEGGLIQSVVSDARIRVVSVDYDAEGADEDEISKIPQAAGEKAAAAVCGFPCSEVDPARARELYAVAKKAVMRRSRGRGEPSM